jgi:hypothetical protein
MRAIGSGATFAVTEITPWPPIRISGSAVMSSPLYTAKSRLPSSFRPRKSSLPRPRSAVASLMPTMPGTCASFSVVSVERSATVRPGTL